MKKTAKILVIFASVLLFAVLATTFASAETNPVEKLNFTITNSQGTVFEVARATGAADTQINRGDVLTKSLIDNARSHGNVFTLYSDVALKDFTVYKTLDGKYTYNSEEDVPAGVEVVKADGLVIGSDTVIDLNGHALYVTTKKGITVANGTLTVYSSVAGGSLRHGTDAAHIDYPSYFFTTVDKGAVVLGSDAMNGTDYVNNMFFQGGYLLNAAASDTVSGVVGGKYYQKMKTLNMIKTENGAQIVLKNAKFFSIQEDMCVLDCGEGTTDFTVEDCSFIHTLRKYNWISSSALFTVTLKDCVFAGFPVASLYGDEGNVQVIYQGDLHFNNVDPDFGTVQGKVPAYGVCNDVISFFLNVTQSVTVDGALADVSDTVKVLWKGDENPEYWVVGSMPTAHIPSSDFVEDGYLYQLKSSVDSFTEEDGTPIVMTALEAKYAGQTILGSYEATYEKIRISYHSVDDNGSFSYGEWADSAVERGALLGNATNALSSPTDFVLWGDVTFDRTSQIWVTKGFSLDLNGYTFTNTSSVTVCMHTDNKGQSAQQNIYFFSSRPGGTIINQTQGYLLSIDPPYQAHFGAKDGKYGDNLTCYGNKLIQGWGSGFDVDGGTYYTALENGYIFGIANYSDNQPEFQFQNATIVLAHNNTNIVAFEKGSSNYSLKFRSTSFKDCKIVALANNNAFGGVGSSAPCQIRFMDCEFYNIDPSVRIGSSDIACTNLIYEGNCYYGNTLTDSLPLLIGSSYSAENGVVYYSTFDIPKSMTYTTQARSYRFARIAPQYLTVKGRDLTAGEYLLCVKYVIVNDKTELAKATWKRGNAVLAEEDWIVGSVPECSILLDGSFYFTTEVTEPITEDTTYEVFLACSHETLNVELSLHGNLIDVNFYVQKEENNIIDSVSVNGKMQRLNKTVNLTEDGPTYYIFTVKDLTAADLAAASWDFEISLSFEMDSFTVTLNDVSLLAYANAVFAAEEGSETAKYKSAVAALVHYAAVAGEAAGTDVTALKNALTASGVPYATEPTVAASAPATDATVLSFAWNLPGYNGYAFEVSSGFTGKIAVYYTDTASKPVGAFIEAASLVEVNGKTYAVFDVPTENLARALTVEIAVNGSAVSRKFAYGFDVYAATLGNRTAEQNAMLCYALALANIG